MNRALKACIALAAFAALAVVPATASALNDATVTHPTGTTLSVSHASPAALLATNTTNLLMTDGSTNTLITCTKGEFHGHLETNAIDSGGAIEGTITNAEVSGSTIHNGQGGYCASGLAGPTKVTTNVGNGTPWCVRATAAMTTDHFEVRGNSCTSAARPITFVLHTTNIGTCSYSRSTSITGQTTTHPTDAILSISHVEFTREAGSGLFCPSAGFLDMSFTLETTTDKTRIYIS